VQHWEGTVRRVGATKDIVKTTKVVVWVPTELFNVTEAPNFSVAEAPECGA
jgi:hypothetical protein